MTIRKRQERIERMTRVEREFRAAAIAADLLWEKLREDPSFLLPSLRARDGEAMRKNIEIAFLIRLFAEFEAGLRDAWSQAFGRKTKPQMKGLVDQIATQRNVPAPDVAAVHRVREYRNSLVHGGEAETVSIEEARGSLNRFFARLPEDW